MVSPTQWIWLWASSSSWWWTGKPGVLQSMGRKESDMTERLNWTELDCSMPDFTVHHQLPELAQIHVHWVVMPSKYLIFHLQWSIYASICFNCSYYITKGSSVEFVEVGESQKHKNRGKTHNYTWIFQLEKRAGTPTHYLRVSCAFLI